MSIKVTYDLADPAGILYFANVYPLAHKNIEHLLAEKYNLWETWFDSPLHGAPIKHSECDYHSPMKLGKNYHVESLPIKHSDSTITFSTKFYDQEKGLCAEVQTVHIFIDRKLFTKISVPKNILDTIFK